MACDIPFERLKHFVRVPITMPRGVPARFLIDTGIGISVVSTAFAERHHLKPTGRHVTGTRMAGDQVTAPLVRLPDMHLGTVRLLEPVAAVTDLGQADGADGFDGILGLDLLGDMPLTIDPFQSLVRLGSNPTGGITVPTAIRRDGPTVSLYVDVCLPDSTIVSAEIDTGSASTILDSQYMPSCHVDPDQPTARTVRVGNETGVLVERSFIPVPGPISLAAARQTAHRGSTVMFQDITMPGLIGTAFLDRYVQTFDTRTGTMTLEPPAP